MSNEIIIIYYGMGSLSSIKRKISWIGVNTVATSNPSDVLKSGKIMLPRIGHFPRAVQKLKGLKLWEAFELKGKVVLLKLMARMKKNKKK